MGFDSGSFAHHTPTAIHAYRLQTSHVAGLCSSEIHFTVYAGDGLRAIIVHQLNLELLRSRSLNSKSVRL